MSTVLLIVFLLAANGLFVAAEFALVKARRFRIEAEAAEGSAAAKLTLRIQGNLEVYLAACQLGITMASLGLGWVGEPAVAALLEPLFESMGLPAAARHTTAFVLGFLLFSSLHIVIGEQVPKTLAIRRPEQVSMAVAWPLHAAFLLAYPFNWMLDRATRAILRAFGVQAVSHEEVLSADELKGLVSTSQEHGEIHSGRADMLRNLFEFDDRIVSGVMVPRSMVHVLDVDAEPDETLEMIRDTEHSRFPVVSSAEADAIVGTLLTRDLYRAMLHGEVEPWRELRRWCRPALVVPETQPVARLLEMMRAERSHLALVVDEYGQFLGIVTLEDLLEEFVGEIQDETDDQTSVPSIVAIGAGRWEVDGLTVLGEVERAIGLVEPDDADANTISGLVMQRLGRIPAVGDELIEGGFRLTVAAITGHRVGRVLVERAAAEAPVTTGGD